MIDKHRAAVEAQLGRVRAISEKLSKVSLTPGVDLGKLDPPFAAASTLYVQPEDLTAIGTWPRPKPLVANPGKLHYAAKILSQPSYAKSITPKGLEKLFSGPGRGAGPPWRHAVISA